MPTINDSIQVDSIFSSDHLDRLLEGDVIDKVSGFDFVAFGEMWLSKLMNFGIKVLIAFLCFFIGHWIIKRLIKTFRKALIRRSFDQGAQGFLLSTIKTLLYVFLLVVVINVLGFHAVSFAALLASAGVTIGMALSGQLQNFAGGAILLFTKPFKVGDYVESNAVFGSVESIGVFHTIVNTPDNKRIYIPNGTLTSNAIVNYSEQNLRRVSWSVQCSYSEDYQKLEKLFREILLADSRILSDPNPEVLVNELRENGVDFVLRGWCLNSDYWGVFHDINERILGRVRQEGLDLSLPCWVPPSKE